MAQNYLNDGETLNVTLAAAATSGTPFLLGTMLVVPITDGAIGDTIAVRRTGKWTLPRVTGGGSAWTQCMALYWDASASKVTHTSNSGANQRIGNAGAAAATTDATGVVILGQF